LAASVCLSVRTKSQTLLVINSCNLVAISFMVNAGSSWKLITFDLQSHVRIISIQAIAFEWLVLATLFLVWRYILRISKSHLSFKVMGQRSRSLQLKKLLKFLRLDRNICYDYARSDLKLLTFVLDL